MVDGHEWLRVADPAWDDPIDTSHSVVIGGRWNPPGTCAALYLSHDLDTARLQILRLLEGTPFEPGHLADDDYDLVTVTLPDAQTALDVVSHAGPGGGRPPRHLPGKVWGSASPTRGVLADRRRRASPYGGRRRHEPRVASIRSVHAAFCCHSMEAPTENGCHLD